jgi:hypothetical protein
VCLKIQVEIQDNLQFFQSQMAVDFQPGAGLVKFALTPAIVRERFQYHHAKLACLAVIKEIQQPNTIGAPSSGIRSLPSVKVICDLNFIYKNCIVITRILKF